VKLAISNLAWPVADDAAVAEVLRSHSIGGVELAPSKVWVRAPRVESGVAEAYAGWWKEAGCGVVAFQAILFGHAEMTIFGDGDVLAATERHLVAMGELAARCGARVLVLGAPGNRKRGRRSMPTAIAAAAAALRPVAEKLAPLGVHLCIEPNPPRYGCDFVTTAAEAAVLADAVVRPNFGVHLDAAALALSGEASEAALAPLMRHVRHFHVSEPDLAPVGTTTGVPHAALGRVLRALGYDGWYSIEMRGGEDDAWRETLPRAIAVAREAYGW
jgi:sugar phosphate isomerase/epimerase